jgi:hypothetical protein
MLGLTILSPSQQVADYLREELLRGRWTGTMPGTPSLAAELTLDRKTIDAALHLLELEGLLIPQGVGRRRKIELSGNLANPSLRVMILCFEPSDRRVSYINEVQHRLETAGHVARFASRTLFDLKLDVGRVARLVKQTPADAWIVVAGSSEMLEWFSSQPLPTFGLFGRFGRFPMAGSGPSKSSSYVSAVKKLVAYGHRRIVLIARQQRRKPQPGATERTFLEALAAENIPVGPYNLPDWDDTKDAFHECLNSLFRVTPPTAMIIQEPLLFSATQQFLAGRSLHVPNDISLICTDPHPASDWCRPSIAHFRWDNDIVLRRVVGWANNVSRGRKDVRQGCAHAEFVEGGTIGPANPGGSPGTRP